MRLIWVAGAIQFGIVLANAWLPGKLRVRQGLGSAPLFLRQIFYVHWMYIVLIVGLFSALCFLFPADLAGGSPLGRFLSFSLGIFWLLRVLLQWLYYDQASRRGLGALDDLYLGCLLVLVAIFGLATVHPLRY
jgi:hypothetical protein